jgi:hypothetical protein
MQYWIAQERTPASNGGRPGSGDMTPSSNTLRDALNETVGRICRDHLAGDVRRRTDGGEWPQALWTALEDAGILSGLLPEVLGGPGIPADDAWSMMSTFGELALPVPAAETMLARSLFARAGIKAPDGILTIASAASPAPLRLRDGRVCGRLVGVPHATRAQGVVAIVEADGAPQLVLLDPAACRIEAGVNLAGEPRDTLVSDATPKLALAPAPLSADALLGACAVMRSAQMAGALRTIQGMVIDYAGLREQFGRKLAGFQAIQHAIARLVEQVAAAVAAAEGGIEALGRDDSPTIAAAKIRSGEAAGLAAAIAHQVLGAIGYTREHDLNLYTRRLWSWRDEFGGEAFWSARLGRRMIAAGPDRLWAEITAA